MASHADDKLVVSIYYPLLQPTTPPHSEEKKGRNKRNGGVGHVSFHPSELLNRLLFYFRENNKLQHHCI